jgi:uncharacterized membrane protein
MTDLGMERERDFDRFLTFVDAIVAIAITLLVLPLVDVAGTFHGDSVTHLLSESRDQIWAFFLSFFVIANLWLTQHRLLRHVVYTDAVLIRLMLLWSLTIVVLPFPTALVAGSTGHQAVTKLLYIGTMAVSALILALVCLVIRSHPEIRDSAESPDVLHAFSVFAVFVVALALMLWFPGLGYWPLVLLMLPYRVIRLWRRRVGAHPEVSARGRRGARDGRPRR